MPTQPNYIDIDDILGNIHQPRQTFIDDTLAELAASIKEHGVIQPLIVYPNTGEESDVYHYRLLAGERRLRASILAGLKQVPCIIRNTVPDAQTELELALIENIQREDLSAADEARCYQRLHDEFKLTDDQIAARVGKARSTVANMRRLATLPEAVLSMVGDGAGQLRERDARRLIAISRFVDAEHLVQAANDIVALDPDERRNIDGKILRRLIERNTSFVNMPDSLWDFAWPAKPIEMPAGSAVATLPACTACDLYLKLMGEWGGVTHYCLNDKCNAAKHKAFADSELKRVSAALGIPAVDQGEKAGTLSIGHHVIDKMRRWVANPPKHLRLTTNGSPKRTDAYYHRDLTTSRMVYLASTDQNALLNDDPSNKSGGGKVVKGGVSPLPSSTPAPAPAKETAEDKAARLKREEQARKEQAEAEHKALLDHWKVCGQHRKATADANWLVTHTAKTLAAKVPLTGLWLELFANKIEDDYVEFDDASVRLDDIEQALRKETKAADREALLREKVLLFLICDGSPDEADLPAVKKHVYEFITGAPGKNGSGGLGLKYTLPEPPIHKTAANCWTCGTFAPFDEISKEQIEEGWIVVQGGKGSHPTNVTCPACVKKTSQPAPKKPAAKSKKN